MTIDEFLDELSKVKASWYMNQYGYIRTLDGYCPICFLGTKKGLNPPENQVAYYLVHKELGLTDLAASIIANTADGSQYNPLYNQKLRDRLIEITGAGNDN